MRSKVVITGTEGFIGRNLIDRVDDLFDCYKINEDIFNTDDFTEKLLAILNDVDPDAIFHIGACSNTLGTDVNYMMERNYQFTKLVSDFCNINNRKLIYSSSAANYGVNGKYPSNLYGWSKYVAEQYVTSKGGVALRYFNVYGPGEEGKGKMASVAYQMWQNKMQNKTTKLFPGNPKRDFVYVDDIVNANLYALKNYEILKSNYFEVGSGDARSFEDVLEILKIPYSYTEEKDIPKGYQFYTKSDSTKWMPGWKPLHTLDSGLKKYLEYLNQ
jgi:ADP-L-glycero-D-manno-heptose 6-epimerase